MRPHRSRTPRPRRQPSRYRRRPSLQHNGTAYPVLPPSAAVLWAHGRDHTLAAHSLVHEDVAQRRGSVAGQARARLQVAPVR